MRKVIIFVICISLFGCYDETALTAYSLLDQNGKWTLTAWTSSPAYVYTYSNGTQKAFTNLFGLFVPCRHDDEYQFVVDQGDEHGALGSYLYTEGSVACGDTDIRESGVWFTTGNTPTGIYWYFGNEDADGSFLLRKIYKLEVLTQEQLIFSYEVTSGHIWTEVYQKIPATY